MLKQDELNDLLGDSFEVGKTSAALSAIFDKYQFDNVGLFFAPVDIQAMSTDSTGVVVCNGRSNIRPVDSHIRGSIKAMLLAVAEQRTCMFPHYWDSNLNQWRYLRSADVLKNDGPVIIGVFSLGSVGELIGIVAETTKAVAQSQLAAFHHYVLLMLHEVIELRRVDFTSILTESETKVLSWCANGKTSYEISKILELSEHTVNHYLANVCRKLHATNRAQATAKAIKLGILPISFIH